jgi:anti-sigma B factor antagonist
MLSIATEAKGRAHVIKFSGSLDALSVPEVRPEVEALIERGANRVVVDLASVSTIDSTGVALLVSLFKRLRAKGGEIRVVGVQGQPREIFQFLKLDHSLPMSGSVDEALSAL